MAKAKPTTKRVSDKQRKNSEAEQRRLANLKPFQPGQSGNPAGRPRSALLSDAIRRLLPQPYPDDPHGRTYADKIAETLCNEAAAGNVQAAKEVADRTEGKAKQTITLSSSQAELSKYEKMITDLLAKAEKNGRQITRERAINLIAAHDERILEVIPIAATC